MAKQKDEEDSASSDSKIKSEKAIPVSPLKREDADRSLQEETKYPDFKLTGDNKVRL